MWLASFDIGKKNFAFYIEEINKEQLLNIKNVCKSKRYKIDGTTTPEFSNIIKDVCLNGKKILFKNTDLTSPSKSKSYIDPEIYHNMIDLLDEYVEYWDKCDAFIIEKQMAFKKVYNTMALKLGQHCYSYFCFKYGRFKEIIEFPAYYKTLILGAPKIKKTTKTGKVSYKAMDKNMRKKWSVKKALSIFVERNDFESASELSSTKKKR